VLHKGTPPNSQFSQAEIAGSSILLGGRATTRQGLSYSGKRDPLARRGTYRRESLDASFMLLMSIRGRWKVLSAGSSAGDF
jgi:hypothetical protein